MGAGGGEVVAPQSDRVPPPTSKTREFRRVVARVLWQGRYKGSTATAPVGGVRVVRIAAAILTTLPPPTTPDDSDPCPRNSDASAGRRVVQTPVDASPPPPHHPRHAAAHHPAR